VARQDTAGERDIGEWTEVLVGLVTSLFDTRPVDAWQLAEVLRAIDHLRDHSFVAGVASSVPLTLSDIRAMVGATVSAPTGRLDLRSGAVTMTAMVPVRNLPARVVCIAGLDEGTLRAGAIEGDDLLATRGCVGERDPRGEGRHLLLDAVMAAQDHLLVTFDGSDVTTNRTLARPASLEELLAAAGATNAVVRHPRRAHDPRNFVADGIEHVPGPFSFDSCRREGAVAVTRDRVGDADERWKWTPLPAVVPPAVTITQLAEACARPARVYLRDRLDLRLPREREAIDQHIPVAITPLERYSLGDDLLRHHRHAGFVATSGEVDEWRRLRRLQGSLPPRALSTAALQEVEEEVRSILDSRPDLRPKLDAADRVVDVDIPLALPPWAPPGTVGLVDRIESITGSTLVRVAFVRPKARGRLNAALALAALVATRPDEQWQVLLAMRTATSGKPTVEALMPLAPHDATAATRFLELALDLRLRAMREPIPLFEFSRDVARNPVLDDDVLEHHMNDDAETFVWSGMTADDLLALPPAAGDPKSDGFPRGASSPSRLVSFAQHLWSAYDDFVCEMKAIQ
jgi:exodeoxyribonuclease V gamma subunit